MGVERQRTSLKLGSGSEPALELPWWKRGISDLTAALQEEWDAMPQQIISRLVNSMCHCCQAVIDAQGHMRSY